MILDAAPRLSPKQILSIGESTARLNIWAGSIRSGKTIASLWRWLMFVADAPRDGELVMFGKTRDSVASNLFEPLSNPDIFGELTRDVQYTSGAPTAKIFGRKIRVIGANDSKAEPKVRGGTWTGAYGDELTTLPEPFFKQALGRLSTPNAKLFGTTNPDNPAHWLRKDYLLDRSLDVRSWHFTLDDNPHLPASYVAAIKAEYKGLWYRRFVLGEWCLAEGAVFEMFDPDLHVTDQVPQLVALPAVGVDYGTTNAFSAHMLGVAAADVSRGLPARLVLTREYRHDPRRVLMKKTDAQFSKELRAWIGTDRPSWIAIDPSAASFKMQMFADGVNNVIDAKNSVLDGIRMVSSLMGSGLLQIHSSCVGLLDELPGYSWDPDAAERGEDKPLKIDDHGVDSARYAVASSEVLWRRHLPASYAA